MLRDKFEEQRKEDRQTLFREKEVQNLSDMIYGYGEQKEDEDTQDTEYMMDCYRYDVHPTRLERYLNPSVKKLLKSKFITGQSSEQIMKNLMNIEDSDEEETKGIFSKGGKQDKNKRPTKEDKKWKKNKDKGEDDDDDESSDGEDEEDEKKPPKDERKKHDPQE